MLRVVLDTTVLVSAARSRLRASHAILGALRQRRFLALVSMPLLLEYESALKRPEQMQAGARTAQQVEAFLDAFCLYAEVAHLRHFWRPQTYDARDEIVLETALHGRAHALVSLNTVDFSAAALRLGLNLYAPGAFHQLISQPLGQEV